MEQEITRGGDEEDKAREDEVSTQGCATDAEKDGGHMWRDCLEEKNDAIATRANGFPTVFVTSSLYQQDESIIMSSPPPVYPKLFRSLG